MEYKITIPPVAEPISLVEAKLHLRVDHTTDDELIKTLITACRQWCEAYEGRAYMLRTSQLKLDTFYALENIFFPPIQSVSSITYLDAAGDTQTLASTVYTLYNSGDYGKIGLSYNQSWPTTRDISEAVTVTYVNGYSTTFTAADTDILTVGNMIFALSDIVRVETDSNDLPSPLTIGTNYYVRTVSGSTFKLATTDSDTTIVNISDAGTGTHYIAKATTGLVPASVKAAMKLLLTHLYENRSQTTTLSLAEIPMGIKNLLFERCW